MTVFKRYIRELHKKGFSSIVLTSVLSNMIIFVGGVLLVHILPKEEYGNYTYTQNVFSMLIIMGDLGISSATMQFATENYKEPLKAMAYIKYGFRMILLLSLFPMFVVLTSYLWYPHSIAGTAIVVKKLFLLPIFQNINLFVLVVLRIFLKNNQYAFVNILNCVMQYLFIVLLAVKDGWVGAVLAKYPATIIITIVSAFFVKNVWNKNEKTASLYKQEKKEYLKLALITQVNAISTTLMNILDVYCVGMVVADSALIASYKSASVLPTALNFIPQSVMVFMVPYFGRNCQDKEWVRSTYKKLSIGLIVVCGVVGLMGGLGASFIIPLVFGEEYKDAIPLFGVLLVGFIFYGGLQCPATNVLYTQRKLKVILMMTILGALGNTVLNIILIHRFGAIGAAYATTVVHVVIGIVANAYLYYVLQRK